MTDQVMRLELTAGAARRIQTPAPLRCAVIRLDATASDLQADPDVTVETPDLLTQGEMDYQVLVVGNQLGHWVEDRRVGQVLASARLVSRRGGVSLSP